MPSEMLTVSVAQDSSGNRQSHVICLGKAGTYEIVYPLVGYTATSRLKKVTKEDNVLLVVGVDGRDDYLIPREWVPHWKLFNSETVEAEYTPPSVEEPETRHDRVLGDGLAPDEE